MSALSTLTVQVFSSNSGWSTGSCVDHLEQTFELPVALDSSAVSQAKGLAAQGAAAPLGQAPNHAQFLIELFGATWRSQLPLPAGFESHTPTVVGWCPGGWVCSN